MTTKSSNETRSATSKRKMSLLAKSRVESSLPAQSFDSASPLYETYVSSVQPDFPVGRTLKPSSDHMRSKTPTPVEPTSPISDSSLRIDDIHTCEEGDLSSTSEDRVTVNHPIRKRSRSPPEEYFEGDDRSQKHTDSGEFTEWIFWLV
jgi:hypothetical protein